MRQQARERQEMRLDICSRAAVVPKIGQIAPVLKQVVLVQP